MDEKNLADKESKSNRRFLLIAIAAAAAAALYFGYHLFSFAFNGYDSKIKSEFSERETKAIEDELGIILPQNAAFKNAKYISGRSPVLMVWIEGIEDYSAFLSEHTGFDPESEKYVTIQINENESSAAKYYSALKEEDSELLECYVYRLPNDKSWTVYIIENDAANNEIKEIF